MLDAPDRYALWAQLKRARHQYPYGAAGRVEAMEDLDC